MLRSETYWFLEIIGHFNIFCLFLKHWGKVEKYKWVRFSHNCCCACLKNTGHHLFFWKINFETISILIGALIALIYSLFGYLNNIQRKNSNCSTFKFFFEFCTPCYKDINYSESNPFMFICLIKYFAYETLNFIMVKG